MASDTVYALPCIRVINISIFFAVLELWLIQLNIDYVKFFFDLI